MDGRHDITLSSRPGVCAPVFHPLTGSSYVFTAHSTEGKGKPSATLLRPSDSQDVSVSISWEKGSGANDVWEKSSTWCIYYCPSKQVSYCTTQRSTHLVPFKIPLNILLANYARLYLSIIKTIPEYIHAMQCYTAIQRNNKLLIQFGQTQGHYAELKIKANLKRSHTV